VRTLNQFKRICGLWCEIFNIAPLKIYKRKICEQGFIAYYSKLQHSLTISNRFLKVKNCEFYCYLFHELGHAYYRYNYNTFKQKVKSELEAEKFSLLQLKKHFPKYYKQIIPGRISCLKELKKIYKHNSYLKPHYFAFKQIKEYK
jgi:predicted HD phosphohydrolase